jgi:hypothetical protein
MNIKGIAPSQPSSRRAAVDLPPSETGLIRIIGAIQVFEKLERETTPS